MYGRNHHPPCEFPQMMILTLLRSQMTTMTQNMILMAIYPWRMMWMHHMALIQILMWIWKVTVTIEWRNMKMSKIRRKRMRMWRRMRSRMVGKNIR
jgi:hypothetical protein